MDHRNAQHQDGSGVAYRSFRNEAGNWSHTIGLNARGLPELIVAGLQQHGEPFLRKAAHAIVSRSGAVDGDLTDSVANRNVMFRSLPVERAGMFAMEAANADPARFHALQVVWPDQAGNWPWSSDCDPETARVQSVVIDFEPPAAAYVPRVA